MKTLTLAMLIAFSTFTAAHAEWEILDPGMPAATKSAPVATATQPVNPSTTPVVAQRQKQGIPREKSERAGYLSNMTQTGAPPDYEGLRDDKPRLR